MRKLKLFLSLLMLFTFSMGTVWAVDYDLVYTLDGTITTGGNSNYDQDGGGLTQNGIDWSVTGNTTQNPWRIGGKSLKGVDRLAYSKTAISANVAKIEIEHGTANLTSINSVKVEVASNSDFSTIIATFTPTFEASKTMTILRESGDWSNCYYRITYNVTQSTNSNKYLQLKSVKFYKEKSASDPVLESITITGDLTNKSYEEGQSIDFAGLTATGNYNNSTTADLTDDVEWSFSPALTAGLTSVTVTATLDEISGNKVIEGLTVTEHVVTPGTYTVNVNSTAYGVAAQTTISNAVELTQNDITVETWCTSGTKPRIDATYVRYYQGSYMLVSVPSGYQITAMTLLEPSSDKTWNGSITVDAGTYTESSKSWEGKAQSVTFSFGATNRCAGVSVTYAVAAAPEPTVYAKQGEDDITELDLGTVGKDFAKSATFSLSGENLTAGNNISLAASAGFSVVPTSVSVTASDLEAQTITVSKNTTTVGNITDGTLTISSDDFDDVVLTLKMDVVAPFVTPSTASIDFGTVLQHADAPAAQTFTVSGSYLKSKVQIAAPEGFSVDVTELTPDETGAIAATTITVTPPSTATSGDFEGNIVISSKAETPEFTAVNVATSMSVTARYAITPSIIGTGTVTWTVADDETANPQYALAGKTVTVGATAGDGYEFGSLALSDNVTKKEIVDDVAEFTMPASDVTITAVFTESEDPYLTASPAEIDFGTISYKGELAAQTFTIEGGNLKGDKVTIAWEDGSDEAAFALSTTEVAISEGAVNTTITVTPRRDVCGNFAGQLNISTTGVATQTVTLGLNVNKLAANLSWSADSYTATIGEENTYPTLSNPRGLENVVYSSLDEDVATVDASTGAITLVGAGETYIIANFAGNDTVVALAEDALYYTLTVQKKYTAKYFINGVEQTEAEQTALAGTNLVFPTDFTSFTDCSALTFMGWAEAPLAQAQDEAPTYTELTAMPAADVNFYAVFATENISGGEIYYDIDFESEASTYTDWTLVNLKTQQTNSNVKAHGGSYFGNTDGKYTASVTTVNKIASPSSLTTYVSKQSTNTTACTWTIQVSETGEDESWADVASVSASSMDRGTWVKLEGDLSSYSNVYVRVYYANNNATRCIDDLRLIADNSSTTYTGFLTTCPSCETLNLVAAEVEHGSIVLKQNGVAVSSVKTCEATTVDVVATAADGYTLTAVALGGDATGASYENNVISIPANLTGTLTATATFSAIDYTVTMVKTGCDAATISDNQTQKHVGDEIEVTANEPEGFAFLGWSAIPAVEFDNAKALSTTFTMPASNVTITATYAPLYTVAQAIDAIVNDGTTSNVVVEGYITDFYSKSVSSGKISYYIQDLDENGFATGEKFEAYNGKGLDNTNFTQLSDLEVGAKVRIYGSIKYYSTGKVYELDNGNYLISYTDPEFSIAWTRPNDDEAVEVVVDLEKVNDNQYVKIDFFKNVFLTGTYTVKVTSTDVVQSLVFDEVGLYEFQIEFNTTNKVLSIETARKGDTMTGVGNTGDGQKAVKVMKDNTIYIIRGDKTYTITGQVVK